MKLLRRRKKKRMLPDTLPDLEGFLEPAGVFPILCNR
jgi:hypothetical protein